MIELPPMTVDEAFALLGSVAQVFVAVWAVVLVVRLIK